MGREAAKLLERVRALRQEQNAAARTARATQAEQPVLPALQAALGPGTGGAASGAAQRSARATSDLHSLASVGGGEADSRVDAWRRAGKGMGPRLLELHRAQADRGVQEYYSREHAARLKAHPPYTGPSEKVLCIDVHQQPCSLPECVSCHFCRQRSTAPKTRCSRCHGVKRNGYGGAWRGVWCGSCLWARMGENIDLLNMDRWLCPCCRDICNCSGKNCQRVGRGLEVTNQLVSEAGHMGYTSVAHYLILTCISDSVVAPELGAPGAGLLAQRRRGDGREPAAKRARVNPREALVVAAAAAAQAQVDAISAELASFAASAAHGLSLSLSGLGVRPQPAESLAGGANAFLRGLGFGRGILEQDMEQGEEEAEAEEEAVTRRAAGGAAGLPTATPVAGEGGGGSRRTPAAARLLGPQLHEGPTTDSGHPASGLERGSRFPAFGTAAEQPPGRRFVRAPRKPGEQRLQVEQQPAPGIEGQNVGPAALPSHSSGPGTDGHARLGAGQPVEVPARLGEAQQQEQQQQQAQVQQCEQLEGLLSTDAGGALHGGVPGAAGAAPRSAAGHGPSAPTPAASWGVQHAVSAAAMPQQHRQHRPQHHQPQRPHHHQQQRITPLQGRQLLPCPLAGGGTGAALPAERWQRERSLTPSLTAPKRQAAAVQQEEARKRQRLGSCSTSAGLASAGAAIEGGARPQEAADASQQLGLTPLHGAGAALDAAEGDGEQHAAAAGNDISLGEEPAGQAMAVTGETVGLAVARVLAAEAGAARSAGSQRMARGAAAQRVALEEDAQHWQENLEVVEWAEVDLYRHDPEDESFNPVTAASMDPELCYQQAYAACMSLLGDIRCQMEEQFECECAVAGAAPPPGVPRPPIFSHKGLHCAVSLLCTLARLLPEEEVTYHIQRRLLNQEPFVDFARCDATARSTLLGGLFHMLNTLASRGLPTAEVCSTIADALTKVADDAWQATQLWYQLVQEDGELPGDDITIGPWTYDADARRRPRGELGGVLYAFAEASYMLLDHELSNLQLMCQQLRHDAVPLITPALLRALLAPEQTLLVQRAGLGLVYAAVHFADGPASMEESPAESSRRRALREQLALTIKEAALPLLEDMLMQAYPLWRPRSEVLPSAGGDEHNGSEAVDTLAHCYALLLKCWPAEFWKDFESRLFSPFGLEGFWRCPNPPHRTFVTYLLAETIGAAVMHSPWALRLSEPTATALLRHWLHGLLDTGGRKALAHLTRSLRSCAELQPLFSQLEEGQLEIGRDQSGEWRAHVVELVGTALAGPLYCGRLPRLVDGLSEVLTKRQEEVKKEAAERTLEAVLCWQSGTYRVLAALLGTLASSEQLRPRLRPLAVSLALMAVSSTEAIFQKEAQRTRAQPQHSLPASEAAGAQRAREWDVPTARHFLRTTTPFCADNLRSLWGVLVSWGAPACFEAANATDILRPLWSVFETCMRLCSGGVKPSPADTAVLEQLAASLAPQGASQAQAGGQLAQLRTYVLEVLVARCLVDSIVRPLHQQLRRAVSALRLTAALLTEPGMRAGHGSLADSPAALALRGLLGHFLRLLDPRVGPPSLGPREALYRLLQLLLKHDPQLLPAMQQASPAEPLGGVCEQVQAALRVFWEAAFRDVLLAVQQPVHETLNQTDIDLCHAKALQQWGQQQLMPQDGRGWGAAAEALFRQDRDSAAVDACARSWGTSLPIPAAAAPLAVAPGAPAPQPPFRPGDFKWSLAEAGLKLLQAALAAGSAAAAAADPSSPALAHTAGSGGGGSLQVAAAWVNACMPSLDEAVRICGAKLGKGAVVKSLRAAYLQLYNHLLAALGPGRMAVTLKRVAKNPAREEAAAGGEHAAPQQQQQAHGEQRQQAAWQAQGAQRQQPARQEQWQPNARGAGEQQLAAAVKDEPASQAIGPQQQAPAPTTAPQQQRRQQPAPAAGQQKQQGAPLPRAAQQAPVDVSSFDRLSGLPRGCIVNLAGRASHEALREGPRTLQLKLRDARGGRAMVAVTSQSSDRLRQRWKQELEQQLDRSRGDTWRSLRVIHLQLMAINNQQFAMITQDTTIEWGPQGAAASAALQADLQRPEASEPGAAGCTQQQAAAPPAAQKPESQPTPVVCPATQCTASLASPEAAGS